MTIEQFGEKSVKSPEQEIKIKTERKLIDIDGQQIEMIIYSPENENNHTPLLFAPGWSISLNTPNIEQFLQEIARERSVVSLSHLRKPNSNKPVEEIKADSLEAVMNASGFSKFNLALYSEGTLNGLFLAERHPEKIENIVLLNPSGIIENKKVIDILKVIKGFNLDLTKLDLSLMLKTYKESLKYLKENLLLSFKEIIKASGGIDITEMIKNLRNKDIKIAIISGANDKVFPMEDMQESITSKELSKNLDGFISLGNKVDGSHFDIIKDYKKIAYVIEYVLKNLENSKNS